MNLGSIYLVAGGLYSLVRFVLPKPIAFIAIMNILLQALIYPSSIALGVGTYLQILFPWLPQGTFATSVLALVVLTLATINGLRNIRSNSILTGSLLFIQIAVLGIITFYGFKNAQ